MRERFLALFKDCVVYGLAGAGGQAVQILLVPVYARYLDPVEYGVAGVVMATTMGLSLALGLQIDSGMARHYYEASSKKERKELVATGLFLLLAVSIAGVLGLIAFAEMLARWITGDNKYASVLIVAFVSIPLSLSITYLLLVFRLERAVWLYSILGIGWAALTATLSIFLVVVMKFGVSGIFWAKLLSDLFIVVCAFVIGINRFTLFFTRAKSKAILSYGLPLVPSTVGGWAQRYIDRYFIISFLSLSYLGLYTVAFQVSSVLLFINRSFGLGWMPFAMSAMGEPTSKDLYSKTLAYYLLVVVPFGTILAVFSREILMVIASPSYWDAAPIVSLLVAAWIAVGISNIVGIGISVAQKNIYKTLAVVIGAVVNLFLLYLLLPVLGLRGAAIAAFISSSTSTMCVYWFAQRLYPINYEGWKVARLIGVFVSVVVLTGVIDWSFEIGEIMGILWKTGMLTLALIAMWLVGTEPQERRALREYVFRAEPGISKILW